MEISTNRPTIFRKINFRGSWTSSSCTSRWTQTNTAPKLTSWHPRGSCTVLSRLHSLCSLTRRMRLTTSTWSQTIGKLANFLWNTIKLPKISSLRRNFKKSHLYLVKMRKTNNSEPSEPKNTHKSSTTLWILPLGRSSHIHLNFSFPRSLPSILKICPPTKMSKSRFCLKTSSNRALLINQSRQENFYHQPKMPIQRNRKQKLLHRQNQKSESSPRPGKTTNNQQVPEATHYLE